MGVLFGANEIAEEEMELGQLVRFMREHAAGQPWDALSDAQLAQRLALAPNDGNKYAQRAWMRRGFGQEDFREAKDAFLQAAAKVPAGAAECDDAVSATTGERLGQMLADPALPDAIRAVPSPHVFLQCWPLVGLAVRIRYHDGALMNPWTIAVAAATVVASVPTNVCATITESVARPNTMAACSRPIIMSTPRATTTMAGPTASAKKCPSPVAIPIATRMSTDAPAPAAAIRVTRRCK